MAHAKWRDVIKNIRNRKDAEDMLDKHVPLDKHGKRLARRKHTKGLVPGGEAHVEVKAALNWLGLFELGLVVEVDKKGPKVKATVKRTKKVDTDGS